MCIRDRYAPGTWYWYRYRTENNSKDYFRCCFYYVNTSMMIRSTIQWIAAFLLLREYQHYDTIQWIAAPKLTEIVEVENETWQGAKFGVC